MGVHPGEPQHARKGLGDCDKGRDLFLMEGAGSEKKGCSTMGYATPSDRPPIKGLDVQGIAEWLFR